MIFSYSSSAFWEMVSASSGSLVRWQAFPASSGESRFLRISTSTPSPLQKKERGGYGGPSSLVVFNKYPFYEFWVKLLN
jgi:hypothetical protein